MSRVVLIDPSTKAALSIRDQLDPLRRFRYFPHLGLQVLADQTPEHDVQILDERLQDIDPRTLEAELVGITVRTALAPRAHELARGLKERDIPVIFGGPYATLTPDLALQDPAVSCVVEGPADVVWSAVLKDFQTGRLRRRYRGHAANNLHVTRRNQPAGPYRPSTALIQVTQGCNFDCSFCVIPKLYANRLRVPQVEQAVRVISEHQAGLIVFVDDNLIGNLAFARQLFAGLRGTGKKWVCQTTINVACDPGLLALMSDAGCLMVNMGLETLNPQTWEAQNKRQNSRCDFTTAIRRLHDHGILASGGFVFGFDEDDESVFDRSIEFMGKSRIDFAACHVLTPYPGLRLYDQLKRQGRILTDDLSRYNTYEVVYKPLNMTPEQLQEGFDRVVREFYSVGRLFRRFSHTLARLDVFSAFIAAFSGFIVNSNLRRGLPIHA